MMSRNRRAIGRWYSGRPSNLVSVTAVTFAVTGIIALATAAYHAVRLAVEPPVDAAPSTGVALVVLALLGIAWVHVSRVLWRRQKVGGYLALGSLAVVGAQWLGWSKPTGFDLMGMAVAVGLIALCWRDLTE